MAKRQDHENGVTCKSCRKFLPFKSRLLWQPEVPALNCPRRLTTTDQSTICATTHEKILNSTLKQTSRDLCAMHTLRHLRSNGHGKCTVGSLFSKLIRWLPTRPGYCRTSNLLNQISTEKHLLVATKHFLNHNTLLR